MRLPSDLAGVTVVRYEANRSDGNILAALGPGCTIIRQAIREYGCVGTASYNQKTQKISAHEKVTIHEERWTLNSGLIHGNDIYFNEITEMLGDSIVEFLEVTLEYRYWFPKEAYVKTAEINFRYKAADTPVNHSWHELLQYSFVPSKTVWKPVRFAVRHSDIRMTWINFTLLHRGQTLKIRNVTTKLLFRNRP